VEVDDHAGVYITKHESVGNGISGVPIAKIVTANRKFGWPLRRRTDEEIIRLD
jgi:hypothetical protein